MRFAASTRPARFGQGFKAETRQVDPNSALGEEI